MVTQSLGKKRKKTDYTFSSRLDRGIFRSPLTIATVTLHRSIWGEERLIDYLL